MNDLKISLDFFNWICGKTEDYKISGWTAFNENGLILPDQNILQAIIYQAIDGINKEKSELKLTEGFKKNELYAFVVFNTDNNHREFYAFVKAYDTLTNARLAALQWLWQQETEGSISE